MSIDTTLETMATKAMEGAIKRGAKDVKAVASKSRSVSVTYRKGKPDRVMDASKRSLAVSVYIDGKYSVSSTNDLRPEALDSFLDSAVVLTKAMASDPYREMTDPALYQGRQDKDLGLFDATEVTQEARAEAAAAAEAAALEAAGDKAISAEGTFQDESGEVFRVHSNGFQGSKKGSQFWTYAEIALQDEGDKRPSGWDVAGARKLSAMPSAASVGKGAAVVAQARLGAKKLPSAKMTMVVEARTVGRLLSYLLAATSGRALQQKRSFLEGMVGKAVGSKLFHLVDDPFIVGGFGSRLFDGEGISAKAFPVFDKGVFQNFFIDTYYGKKLSMPPTTGGRSNLVIPAGDASLTDLVAGIDKGILVRGFIGGNSNSTTGDFSLGVYGTAIEKGALGGAVAEMNIAGNHQDLWKHIVAVGNDTWPYSSVRVPSLVFEDVQFAGL